MKRLVGLLTAGIVLAATSGMVSAQDRYPSQSIKFVVPFAAGSATDTLARLLGHRVTATLGQNVVIENIAGGSGVIAAQSVVRSRAGRPYRVHYVEHDPCLQSEPAEESSL